MSDKPDWIPQDDWDRVERAAREDQRRRADAAAVYIAQQMASGKTTPGDPRLAAVRAAKDRAIDRQDFDAAARFRDEEKRLLGEE